MAGYPQLYVLWSSHRWSHRLCGPRIRISNNCLTLEQILSRDARRRYSVVLHICSSLVDVLEEKQTKADSNFAIVIQILKA